MTVPDEKENRPYTFAFRLGLLGLSGLLLAATLFRGYLLFFLALTTLWTLATVFVFPWVYLWYHADGAPLPAWAYRGPHQ